MFTADAGFRAITGQPLKLRVKQPSWCFSRAYIPTPLRPAVNPTIYIQNALAYFDTDMVLLFHGL